MAPNYKIRKSTGTRELIVCVVDINTIVFILLIWSDKNNEK